MKIRILNFSILLSNLFICNVFAQTKSLSLKEAINMAQQENRELQYQRLEEARTKEYTKEIQSRLRPTIGVQGNYSHYFDRQVIFLPGSFAGTEADVQDVAVGGKQVFNGMVNFNQPLLLESQRHEKFASRISESIQHERVKEFQDALVMQVTLQYYQINVLKSERKFLENSLARQFTILKEVKSKYEQGRALKLDTLIASIDLQKSKSSISQVSNKITSAEGALSRLLGLTDFERLELTDSLDITEDWSNLELMTDPSSFENNSEIKVKQLELSKTERELRAKRSELLPQGYLVGGYQLQAQADNLQLSKYAWPSTSFVGIQISIPIISGGRVASKISQTKIKMQQNKVLLDDAKTKLRIDTKTLVNSIADANYQVIIDKNTLSSSKHYFEMVYERYQNGFATRLELTEAELSLSNNEKKYLYSIYQLKYIRLELKKALGLLSSSSVN